MALIWAAAAWGFSTAVSLWRLFARAAPREQAAGFMSAHNLNAGGPAQHIVFVIAFTVVAALVGRLLADRFAALRRSSQLAVALSLGSSLAIVTVDPSPLFTAFLPAAMSAIFAAARKIDLRFESRDVVLIPATVVVAIAILRLTILAPPAAVVSAVFLVMLVRIAVALIAPDDLAPATAFLLSPLGIIAEAAHALSLTVLIAALALPLLTARIRVRRHTLLAHIVYPTFLVAYTFALLNASPPFLNLYERGHDLVPAAEANLGKKYYRDVIPLHGLLSDGVIDQIAMRFFGDTAGDVLRFRFVIAALHPAAIYAVAACATGSAEAGLLAALLTIGAFPSRRGWTHVWPRTSLPVLSLAAAAGATLRRSRQMLALSALLAVLAIAQSVDFGIYAVITVLITPLFWSRPRILAALRSVGIGIGAGVLILAIALAISGILVPFVVTTFGEILTLGPSFGFGFFDVNQCCPGMTWLSDVAVEALLAPTTLPFVAWPLVLIWFAVTIGRRRTTVRWRAVLVVAVWVIVTVMSFAARRQDYAVMLIPTLAVILICSNWRRLRPGTAVLVILLCVIVSHPAWHLFRTMPEVARRPEIPPQVASVALPRVRGAVVDKSVASAILIADATMRQTLGPHETFFDFANAPGLYYVTDRRLPIRQIQVPQYEDVRLQREVIAALERDPSVKLALMRFPEFAFTLDGVPNTKRAPLVAQYLEAHFAPAFEQDGVVFWKRR